MIDSNIKTLIATYWHNNVICRRGLTKFYTIFTEMHIVFINLVSSSVCCFFVEMIMYCTVYVCVSLHR